MFLINHSMFTQQIFPKCRFCARQCSRHEKSRPKFLPWWRSPLWRIYIVSVFFVYHQNEIEKGEMGSENKNYWWGKTAQVPQRPQQRALPRSGCAAELAGELLEIQSAWKRGTNRDRKRLTKRDRDRERYRETDRGNIFIYVHSLLKCNL